MDAQEMQNMSKGDIFVEGDSDVIEEADDHNNSFDNVQRIRKGPRSLDDCEED
jgi:hypothetical protein